MRTAELTGKHLETIREVGLLHGIPEDDIRRLESSYKNERRGWWARLRKTRAERDEAQTQASIDSMTGLYNRRAGMQKISRLMGFTKPQLEKRIRTDKAHKEINLLAIDLNRLNRANNRYGHEVGDAYIKSVADAIKEEGVAIRMGGDEMAVATEFQGHEHLKELRKRIHERSIANFNAKLAELQAKFSEDARKQRKVGKAMKDLEKGRFSLAIGSVSIVRPENLPPKQKGKPLWIRRIARYIPNFMNLKPQEESGLFHAAIDMDRNLGEHRTETPQGYIDSALGLADLLGYLHKYTRKRKASSAILADVDAIRRREAGLA